MNVLNALLKMRTVSTNQEVYLLPMQSSLGVNVIFFLSEPTGTQTNIKTKKVRSYSIH